MLTRRGFGSSLAALPAWAALLPAAWELQRMPPVQAHPLQEISYAEWCNIGSCFYQAKSGPNFRRFWRILYGGQLFTARVYEDSPAGQSIFFHALH
jgi:hypothetical protein